MRRIKSESILEARGFCIKEQGRIYCRRGPRPLRQVSRIFAFVINILLEDIIPPQRAALPIRYMMTIVLRKDGECAKTMSPRGLVTGGLIDNYSQQTSQ